MPWAVWYSPARLEPSVDVEGVAQQVLVVGAAHLDGAQGLEVGGEELDVEQSEATVAQVVDQVNERHLAGVAFAAEHALAEEGAAQRDTVEAADQAALRPALDRVDVAALEERRIERDDLVVDSGLGMTRAGFGTGLDYAGKIAVGAGLEDARADAPCKPPG